MLTYTWRRSRMYGRGGAVRLAAVRLLCRTHLPFAIPHSGNVLPRGCRRPFWRPGQSIGPAYVGTASPSSRLLFFCRSVTQTGGHSYRATIRKRKLMACLRRVIPTRNTLLWLNVTITNVAYQHRLVCDATRERRFCVTLDGDHV